MVTRAEDSEGLLESVAAAPVVAAPSLYASELANAVCQSVNAGEVDAETTPERLEEALTLIDALPRDRGSTRPSPLPKRLATGTGSRICSMPRIRR
jgi:hypothetical protein